MEETLARIFQFTIAIMVAFSVALWFALVVWTYRDIIQRSENTVVQIFSTLLVLIGYLPGMVIYLLLRPKETIEARYQRAIEEDYLEQELNALPVCPECGYGVRDEYIFCPNCSFVLRQPCASCGRLVDANWAVCAYCGASQQPSRARPEIVAQNGRQKANQAVRAQVQPAEKVDQKEAEPTEEPVAAKVSEDTGELPIDAELGEQPSS